MRWDKTIALPNEATLAGMLLTDDGHPVLAIMLWTQQSDPHGGAEFADATALMRTAAGFFHIMKMELVHRERYVTWRRAQFSIFKYIETSPITIG